MVNAVAQLAIAFRRTERRRRESAGSGHRSIRAALHHQPSLCHAAAAPPPHAAAERHGPLARLPAEGRWALVVVSQGLAESGASQ